MYFEDNYQMIVIFMTMLYDSLVYILKQVRNCFTSVSGGENVLYIMFPSTSMEDSKAKLKHDVARAKGVTCGLGGHLI